MARRIVTLPGDGIGPEIMSAALQLLRAVGEFEFDERAFGGASIDAHGTALTDEGLAACRRAAARAGTAGIAPGARAVREPAARKAASGAVRRLAAAARAH